ncbi:MAG: peptide-methionine (S)-S-oxide reductase MsrA [Longimonas sp.]|uniref:peptide-methionine (S)-S-oxide reductase MsrA n=1 Tax=Longimonas sp. TaxID=2039626 RepID=UPI003975B742
MRTLLLTLLLAITTLLLGCADASSTQSDEPADTPDVDISALAQPDTATFAGGCFWCMEPPYDKLDGVAATISGFSGGDVENPSYDQVTGGDTGHTEVVQVIYDAEVVDYETLLEVYWRNIDPLDDGGQFCDRGNSYRPAIFAHNDTQRERAESTKTDVQERFDEEVVVPIQPFEAFYAAEDYHQNYYEKNPGHYNRYRQGCGRDARLEELWGDEAGATYLTSDS